MRSTSTSEATDRSGEDTFPIPLGRTAVAAVVGAAAVVGMDWILGHRGFLHERPPDWSVFSVARAFLLAAASVSAVVAADRWATARLPADSYRDPRVDGRVDRMATSAAAAVGLGVAVVAAALVLIDPASLTNLTEEDGVVEWASAILAFAAAALFAVAAVTGLQRAPQAPSLSGRRPLVLLAGLCGFCFLVGMEEVSWFQRVLDIESPDAVRGRNQPEFNLHNEATDLSENVYYGVGFVILVLIPGLFGSRRLPRGLADLEPVVPSPAVMFSAVASTVVVYEMWEVVPVQMMFFAGPATVALYGRRRAAPESVLALLTIVVLVAVAVVFVGLGHRMTRSWDDTEVRELLLPLGFVVYGWGAVRRMRLSARSRSR